MSGECFECAYFVYDDDDDDEEYYCDLELDEDDAVRMETRHYNSCPYFRSGDEYKVVRHQI